MVTAWEVYQAVDRLAPFSSAEEWDNSGFLLGRKENR